MEEFLRTDSDINDACTLITNIQGTLMSSSLDTTEALQRCNTARIALLAIQETLCPYINQARALQDEEENEEEEEWEKDCEEEEEEEETVDKAQLIDQARAILSREYIQNILGDAADVLFDALDVYELYGEGIQEAA